MQCQKNSSWFIDGVGAEISGLLKTDCNVIASFRAGKMERGILVHEWRRLNERERRIFLQRYSCCMLELQRVGGRGGASLIFCVKYTRKVSFDRYPSIKTPICQPPEVVSNRVVRGTRAAADNYFVYPFMWR